MSAALEPFRLHAYVDGELSADEIVAIERALAEPTDDARAASAEVAALRAQKTALHARYDALLATPHRFAFDRAPRHADGPRTSGWQWFGSRLGTALAAMLVLGLGIGIAAGWLARGRADATLVVAGAASPPVASNEARLDAFARTAAVSHAIFTPEVRHPVEVTAADEAHLVAWLSKRLDAPVTAPHLADAGWNLLGGRLLPADAGPVAQFMYQDAQGRRLTLAVSHPKGNVDSARPDTTFRIAQQGDDTVFYWIDASYSYALTGKLARPEMTALAERVYRALDRPSR